MKTHSSTGTILSSSRIAVAVLVSLAVQAQAQQDTPQVEQRVQGILSQMSLAEKFDYIGGTGAWDVKPIPPIPNLNAAFNPQIFGTDAGIGVRLSPHGPRYPAGLLLAATWNVDRARDYGTAIARDTRARGYFDILAPGMDFYRTPLGGRNFEYMTGEDPFLGRILVPSVINAIQAQGVWATAKHFVANDQETNRLGGINERIDERALREIYMPPFEAAVKQGHVATVMGAFQRVNGDYCCENHFLDTEVLKNDWGYRGILESDYDAIHDGVKAALAGCDLDMPTGTFMNSQTLSGQIPVSIIDDKVRRIVREVVSFGFLDRQQLNLSIPLDDPDSESAITNSAREGIVLLKNEEDILPLHRDRIRSIAVIGNNAQGAPPTGYGSSYVDPTQFVGEMGGIQSEASAGTNLVFIDALTPNAQTSAWEFVNSNGLTQLGLQGEYFDSNDLFGAPQATRLDPQVNFDWGATPPPISNNNDFSVRWKGKVRPTISGDQVFKVRADGGIRLIVNGVTLIDNVGKVVVNRSIQDAVPVFAKIQLQAGQAYDVELDYERVLNFVDVFGGLTGVQFSWASLQPPPNFAHYDAVIMCEGVSNEYEGEGQDRSFELPEFQSELIQNVSQVNPRTIVVLHGGGNFDIETWVHQVPALLFAWYPGQNGGQALAEILFGDVNPSGKLPVTFEKRITDNPAFANFPMPLNNATTPTYPYSEGVFIGYRYYEKHDTPVQFPFGFGLSYTKFSYSDLDIDPNKKEYDLRGEREEHSLLKVDFKDHHSEDTDLAKVSFTVTNTGKRAGAEIAELYVGEKNATVPRPIKELKGFKKVFLEPGESRRVTLELDQRSFAYFNTATERWEALADKYNILIGSSSQDIRLQGQVELKSELISKP
jgi:beta-glucosidase